MSCKWLKKEFFPKAYENSAIVSFQSYVHRLEDVALIC